MRRVHGNFLKGHSTLQANIQKDAQMNTDREEILSHQPPNAHQDSGLYELTVPQEIICWITIAIATANRVNPERIITALERFNVSEIQ